MQKLCLIPILLTFIAIETQSKIYKWTDAQGNVHYSNVEPENTSTQEVVIKEHKPLEPSNNTNQSESENESENESKTRVKSNKERLAEYSKKNAQAKKLAREKAKKRKAKCTKAKQKFTKFKKLTIFGRVDPQTGKTIVLKEQKRVEMANSAQADIRKYCK